MNYFIVEPIDPTDNIFEYFIIDENRKIVHFKGSLEWKSTAAVYVRLSPIYKNDKYLKNPVLLTEEELFVYLL